jgi:DNA-binding MarR family transcriptional regulator
MSYTDTVFQRMPFDREISAEELAQTTHLKVRDVGQALDLLEKGGMIEKTVHEYFIKKRKYKSKQRNLFG